MLSLRSVISANARVPCLGVSPFDIFEVVLKELCVCDLNWANIYGPQAQSEWGSYMPMSQQKVWGFHWASVFHVSHTKHKWTG